MTGIVEILFKPFVFCRLLSVWLGGNCVVWVFYITSTFICAAAFGSFAKDFHTAMRYWHTIISPTSIETANVPAVMVMMVKVFMLVEDGY